MKKLEEIESWLQLWRVSGIGPKHFQTLLTSFEKPIHVLESNLSSLKQAGVSDRLANKILDSKPESIESDLDWLNLSEKHHIITIHCDSYPSMLKQISDPPAILYVHGDLSLLKDPQIAIVGSRNPTQSGMTASYDFSHYLGKTGLCITSGLALGVDGAAHKGALEVNAPTIAVIATGIDRVYPAKHRELAHKIVENGVIVSEFPIGTQPHSGNFPRRNRIISGLSYGTLVVEAALRSGSLITARLASEQNREVFAMPGSIHNPLARGCHQLIRQGAKLVETAQDILEEMSAVIDLSQLDEHDSETEISTDPQTNHEDDEEYTILLDKMGFDPVPIDELVVRTGYSSESIAAMLLMLELQDRVSSNGGGTYTRLI